MSDQVNLLIRSAVCNDDKKIAATLDWTVLKVKQQIEADWPNHPPPHDQRLVYAGKLLQDGSRLREVLRLEDLPNPFIIHLVCRQLSPPPTASASPRANSEGLRRRTTTTSTPAAATTPSAPSPTSSVSSSGLIAPTPWMHSYAGHSQHQMDGTSMAFDQAVAMQQMYAQYVNHYMQYLQSAGGHFAAAGIHTWNGAAAGVAHAAVHDPHQADAGNNVLEPMAAAAAAATAAVAGGQAVAGNHGAAIGDGQHQQVNQNMGGGAPAPEVAAANVGPNPPNVVMNANAGGLGAIEDDEDGAGGQRDILDWFYVASRVLVLFSIVYFYSSLARFALVAGVCVVLYLYQIGFFGQPRGLHNNPVRQQPAQQQPPPQQQQQDLIRQQVDEVRQAAGGGDANAPQEDAISQQQPQVQAEPEVASPNYLSVVSTFVTTFFSSLIPHDPQVV